MPTKVPTTCSVKIAREAAEDQRDVDRQRVVAADQARSRAPTKTAVNRISIRNVTGSKVAPVPQRVDVRALAVDLVARPSR